MTKQRIISAPGKLMIAGEYAVLEGQPAIVAAVNRKLFCTLKPADELSVSGLGIGPLRVSCDTGRAKITDDDQNIFAPVRAVLDEALAQGLDIPSAHFHFDSSELFLGRQKIGLGSSAALISAFAAQIVLNSQRDFNERNVFELAYCAHRRHCHGMGSGIDIAAACFGSLIKFSKDSTKQLPLINKLPPSKLLVHLVCVYTGHSQCTRSNVSAVANFKMSSPSDYDRLMGDIAKAAAAMERCLISSNTVDWAMLHEAVGHHNEALMQLEKSTGIDILSIEHRKIIEIANCFGAVAKPSGAGGGDIAICFVPPNRRTELTQKLASQGFRPVELCIATQGVRLET